MNHEHLPTPVDIMWDIVVNTDDPEVLYDRLKDHELSPLSDDDHQQFLQRCYTHPKKIYRAEIPYVSFAKVWVYVMTRTPLAIGVGMHLTGYTFNNNNLPNQALWPLRIALKAYTAAQEYNGIARVQTSLANVLYFLSEYDEAITLLESAHEYFSTQPNRFYETTQVLTNLIDVYLDLGDATQAMEYIQDLKEVSDHVITHAHNQVPHDHEAIYDVVDFSLSAISAETKAGWAIEEGFADLEGAHEKYLQAATLLAELDSWLQSYPQVYQEYASTHEFRQRTFRLNLNRALLALRFYDHAQATQCFHHAEHDLQILDTTHMQEDWIDLSIYRMYQAILQGDPYQVAYYYQKVWPLLDKKDHELSIREIAQQLQLLCFLALDSEIAEVILKSDKPSHEVHYDSTPKAAPYLIAMLRNKSQDLQERFSKLQGSPAPYMIRIVSQALLSAIQLAFIHKQPDIAHTLLSELTQSTITLSPWQHLTLHYLKVVYTPQSSRDSLYALINDLQAAHDYRLAALSALELGKQYEEDKHPDQAYALYEQAADLIERWAGGAYQNNYHLLKYRQMYERAFIWHHAHQNHSPYHIEQLWHWSERLRSRMHGEELMHAQLLTTAPIANNSQLADLRQRLRYLYAVIVPIEHGLRGMSTNVDVTLQEEYIQVTQEILRILSEQRAIVSKNHGDVPIFNLADSVSVATHLPEDTAVISFQWVQPDDTYPKMEAGLYAIILHPNSEPLPLKILSALGAMRLKERTDIWKQNLKNNHFSNKEVHSYLEDIWDTVLSQILKKLDLLVTTLIFIPDEAFSLLPLHLACVPQSSPTDTVHYRYLCEDYIVSYVPSASLLLTYMQRYKPHASVSDPHMVVAGWKSFNRALESVQAELDQVCHHLKIPSVAVDTLDRTTILEQMIHASLVHLSSHGIFIRQQNPMFSYLHTGKDHIYTYDFYGLALRQALVVLSACDVGQLGRGLHGMVTTLLSSGAVAVMAAMWEVVDKDSPAMMDSFYSTLTDKNEATIGEAYQSMQRAMIKEGYSVASWGVYFLSGLPWARPHF